MGHKSLPHTLDIKAFSKNGEHYRGRLTLSTMKRLSDFLANSNGFVQVSLFCGYDLRGLVFVKIKIETQVQFICQRCLQLFTMPMEIKSCLSPITHDNETKCLPDAYEPVMVQDDCIEVKNMVEDELIINLPSIPKHKQNDCKILFEDENENEKTIDRHRKKPFAQLKKHFKDKDV